MNDKALATLTVAEMEKRVDMGKFPAQLTPQDKKLLAVVAVSYGFDPIMGELMVYQGRPFVTIDGRYRKAHETGELDGVSSRPATDDEIRSWGIPKGDFFFRAEVWRKGHTHPYIGWGRVRAVETEPPRDPTKAGYRPLETNPQRMAEKRAEAQALRKAFILPLPSWEEPEAEEEGPPTVAGAEVSKPVPRLMDAQPPEPTKVATSPSKPNPPQDPTTWGDLAEWVYQTYGKMPGDVWEDFGIGQWNAFPSVAIAVERITARYGKKEG